MGGKVKLEGQGRDKSGQRRRGVGWWIRHVRFGVAIGLHRERSEMRANVWLSNELRK